MVNQETIGQKINFHSPLVVRKTYETGSTSQDLPICFPRFLLDERSIKFLLPRENLAEKTPMHKMGGSPKKSLQKIAVDNIDATNDERRDGQKKRLFGSFTPKRPQAIEKQNR